MSSSNQPEKKAEQAFNSGTSGSTVATMSGCNKTPQQIASAQRLKSTQAAVDEVVGIIHNNVEKLIQRDEHLVELKDRSDKLEDGALKFKKDASTVRSKFFMENRKIQIIMISLALVILFIICYMIFA